MAYKSIDPIFMSLSDEQEREFRKWARQAYEPDPLKADRDPFKPNPAIHHPVIIEECNTMDREWRDVLKRQQTKPPFGKAVK